MFYNFFTPEVKQKVMASVGPIVMQVLEVYQVIITGWGYLISPAGDI